MAQEEAYENTDDLNHEDLIARFTGSLGEIYTYTSKQSYLNQDEARNQRYQLWSNQYASGRKEKDGSVPFKGASDSRIRIADNIINEQVALVTTAIFSGLTNVNGVEFTDDEVAGYLTTLARWIIKNRMKSRARKEVIKLLNYVFGDEPAAGVMWITWDQTEGRVSEEVTFQDIQEAVLGTGPVAPEILTDFAARFIDPERELDAVAAVRSALPSLTDDEAADAVKSLRETYRATVELPALVSNKPVWKALRVGEDVFFPPDTTEFQDAREVFFREWVSETELKSRRDSMGYSREFIEQALKHKGDTAFPQLDEDFEYNSASEWGIEQVNSYKHCVELITVYYRDVDDDWNTRVMCYTFNGSVEDMGAKEPEVMPYNHNQYPGVYFQREVLGDNLTDSRSITQIVSPDAGVLKMLTDSNVDNAQITAIPPLNFAKRTTTEYKLRPMAQNHGLGRDLPKWLEAPEYSRTAGEQYDRITSRINEYFHRRVEGNDPNLVALMEQFLVDNIFDGMSEVMNQTLQLSMQYLDEQQILRITGAEDVRIFPTRAADIREQYDITFDFDVRTLDPAFVENILKVFKDTIFPMDTRRTIDPSPIVAWGVGRISPQLGAKAVRPVEEADQNEIEDEELLIAKIASGQEPPMPEEGLNFALRLQVWQDKQARNPEFAQDWNDVSRAIADRRMEYLYFQVQQQQNAQIGRTGTTPALEDPAVIQAGV